MCKCRNVAFGSYDRQVEVVPLKKNPIHNNLKEKNGRYKKKETVAVDICLVQEVVELWFKGIRTTGCCCGHNHGDDYPYIGVVEEDIQKMKDMDYKVRPNHLYPLREDSFIPKSVKHEEEPFHFIESPRTDGRKSKFEVFDPGKELGAEQLSKGED